MESLRAMLLSSAIRASCVANAVCTVSRAVCAARHGVSVWSQAVLALPKYVLAHGVGGTSPNLNFKMSIFFCVGPYFHWRVRRFVLDLP